MILSAEKGDKCPHDAAVVFIWHRTYYNGMIVIQIRDRTAMLIYVQQVAHKKTLCGAALKNPFVNVLSMISKLLCGSLPYSNYFVKNADFLYRG